MSSTSILNRLASFRRRPEAAEEGQGRHVYPIAVVAIAVLILVFIMIYVVPQFETMFKELTGSGLPAPTQLLHQHVSELVQTYWFLLPGIPFIFSWL